MGTVHLTSGHHGLCIHNREPDLGVRVELDPMWLKRPILGPSGAPLEEIMQKFTVSAFEALLELPFDSAVSYGIASINCPQLQHPHRVWGEITLDGPKNVIVRFSHDTRKGNAPYRLLTQWIEGLVDFNLPDHILDGVLGSWNKGKWKKFFLEKLDNAAKQLEAHAVALRAQAQENDNWASRIRAQIK